MITNYKESGILWITSLCILDFPSFDLILLILREACHRLHTVPRQSMLLLESNGL